MTIHYLDNNATTPVCPEVIATLLPYLTDYFYNPSSAYEQAKITKNAIEAARTGIARMIGAAIANEVIFTGSATESNNTAIKGTLAANPNRRHLVTTAVEHPSVLEVIKDLERSGYQATYLSVDRQGELDIKELIHAIRPDTAIVTIMHANNETGVVFPVEKLAKLVKMTDPAILFHSDATQSMGKLKIDLSHDFRFVDLLSFSGHKLHAPKGVGVLYVRKGSKCRPLIIGGHQENGRRAGTENTAYIVGLEKALILAENDYIVEGTRLKSMRDRLEAKVLELIPHTIVNGKEATRLITTSSISFECIEGESILTALNRFDICASTGSACSSGSLAPSHVLQAMKIPLTAAHGTIRFSLGRYTTEEDIDVVIEVLPGIIENIRNISPYWDRSAKKPKQGIGM